LGDCGGGGGGGGGGGSSKYGRAQGARRKGARRPESTGTVIVRIPLARGGWIGFRFCRVRSSKPRYIEEL